ncbi:MAG: FG-GAP-like repeat-containing protein [Acidobacteriota bacterium]
MKQRKDSYLRTNRNRARELSRLWVVALAIVLWPMPGLHAQPAVTVGSGEALDDAGRPVDRIETIPRDQYGRPIYDSRGERTSYDYLETAHLTPLSEGRAARSSASGASTLPFKNTMTIALEWHRSIYGVGIGDTGLNAADLDGDGSLEVVAGGGPRDFFKNDFWYVLRYDGSGYPQVWARHQYTEDIRSLRTADLDGDGDDEVLVGVDQDILIYDGLDPVLTQTVATNASEIRGLNVVDVDSDGALELVFCDASRLFVHDLATGAQEYLGSGFGGLDLAIGNVDADTGLEIVIGNGTSTGWVLDGATRAVEWTNASGFGDHVDLGDFDSDGMAEIVAAFRWNDISVFDADLQAEAYMIPVTNELGAMQVLDVENDGALDIVYGNGQWGSIHAHDGASGALKWSRSNPEHGVTDLTIADVDGDGDRELLWGAGFSSSGEDFLFVVDTFSLTQEWQSAHITGPFRALDHGDLDGDGRPELVHGSFESDAGSGDGLYFVHDAATQTLEFTSGEPTGSNWTGLWRLRQANIDGDPQNELFVTTSTTYTGKIIAYDGSSHTEQWQVATESGLTFLAMQVADVDADGALEIIASTGREHTGASGVYLYVYGAASGALEWQSASLGANFVDFPLLRVADVDGDGVLEMLVGREGGELQVFDGISHAQELITGDLNLSALDTPDRDGDGTAEILIGTEAGLLQVLDPVSGAVVESVGAHGGRIDGLDVADLDGDGSDDYIFGVADSVRVQSGASGAVLWSSGDIGTAVGNQDSLLVADVDADGNLEIFVNLGEVGVRLYAVDLTDPEVTILAPASGTSFRAGEPIQFDGLATDAEDGDLSASLVWSSDLDGSIGSGASFSTGLTAGSHLITALVTDSGGLQGSDQITLTIDPNTAPNVLISSPSDGTTVIEGDLVTFTGSASDAEEGDLTAGLAWTSDLDGSLGSGASFSLSTLSVGSHLITAAVTDIGGLESSATVTLTVDANTPPTVAITTPTEGATFIESDLVTFGGTASDTEDGDLTASLAWTSSLDGAIGSGGSFSLASLSVGTHVITAAVTDSHGADGSADVTITVNGNTPPSVVITSPVGGMISIETDPVTFTGTATDTQDGDLTASLVWTSSLDGAIGSGGSFVLSSLSLGSHVITASVTDSHGASGSANVTITVNANTPPSVGITAPADGSLVTLGDLVTFTGAASDLEDGDLSGVIAWSSSLDGALGSGASLATSALSQGIHTITATVADRHGLGDSAAISLRVLSLPIEVTLISIAAHDGRIRESSEDSNVGGTTRSSNSNNRALRVGDAGKDRQRKSFVSFDTSQVPAAAVVTSANLRLRRGRVTGTNPFTTHGACRVDVQTGGFGGDVALASSDFQATATVVGSATMSNPLSNGDWSEGSLDAAGLAAIDRSGVTQMRIYFDLDDNDDGSSDFVGYYSGEHSNADNHPQLVVTYQE